ncbi:hypothetical protein HY504_02300 [Candidatus Wolfebacteria bacterium]|nr:hypothetical protein [Candidatus Wolfebacteria bacterium]
MKKILYTLLFAGLCAAFSASSVYAQGSAAGEAGTPLQAINPEVRARLLAQLDQMLAILVNLQSQYAAQSRNLPRAEIVSEASNREALSEGLGMLRNTLAVVDARIASGEIRAGERASMNAMLAALRENLLTVQASLASPYSSVAVQAPAAPTPRRSQPPGVAQANPSVSVPAPQPPSDSTAVNESPAIASPAESSERAETASLGSSVSRPANPWPYIIGAIILVGAGIWFWRSRADSQTQPA